MNMQKHNLKINKKQEKQSGITLVALVITVVVMLILAGVAIAAVVDGDGLFSKTREATEVYENAAENENDTVQSLMNEIDKYIENPSNPILKEPAILGTIVSENQTFDGRLKGTYDNPIIPKGFAAVGNAQDSTITADAVWGSEDGYQKGLVIQDGSGNQFVWIPVDGTTVKFERYDFGFYRNGVFEDYLDPETQELTNITNSVTTNGGFYIARYEAGKPQTGTLATDGSVKPVSKQGANVWNKIAWSDNGTNDDTNPGNGAVTLARKMYPDTLDSEYGVTSTLVYGVQWDTALKFIGTYGGDAEYAINSAGKGNYNGTEAGDPSLEEADVCGAYDIYRQKNIYDMAGNVSEWIMEKYSTNRVLRGGSYYGSGLTSPASNRFDSSVVNADPGNGFRVALYIK